MSPSGLNASNYVIAFVDGFLSITPAGSMGTVSSSANPAVPGSTVSFTCTLNGLPSGAGAPSGVVQFKVDGVNAGTPVALSGGVAV